MRLLGLVLSGGESRRMGFDKGSIVYGDVLQGDQRKRCLELLKKFCDDVWLSCRKAQAGELSPDFQILADLEGVKGPAAGILAAHRLHPSDAFLVLACDFPEAREDLIEQLVAGRESSRAATVFENPESGMLEPLMTIWEPEALRALSKDAQQGKLSPRHCLESLNIKKLRPLRDEALLNINTEDELKRYRAQRRTS